jgi:hypothetical protein
MHQFRYLLLLSCITSVAADAQATGKPCVDTSLYAILKYDEMVELAMDTKFDKPSPTNLLAVEVDCMEALVDSSYHTYNETHPNRQLMSPLSSYRRQYVAVIDGKGQKVIWINFFNGGLTDELRHHVLIVDDGGVYYFQMMINLSDAKVIELIPNGAA